jgi:Acetyltransferases
MNKDMNEKISVRKAEARDLDEIIKLLKQLHEAEYPIEKEITSNMKETSDYFIEKNIKKLKIEMRKGFKNKKELHIIAELNNKVVGYLNGLVGTHYSKKKKYSYLDQIVIDNKYRKKGIAQKLMFEFEKFAKQKKANHITLAMFSENEKAMNLYKKEGYKIRHYILYKKLDD